MALNVRQALGGIFTLQQNTSDPSKWVSTSVGSVGAQSYYGGEPLTVDLAERIMAETAGIIGYNAAYTNYTVPLNADGKILELIDSNDNGNGLGALMAGHGDFNSTVSTIAATNTAYDSYFAGGYLELVEGRHFTTESENPAIISAELAELNGLRVGDKITLRMSEYKASMMGIDAGKTNIEVTIVGLFRSAAKSTTSLSNWSMDNSIFTTLEVVKSARPDMGDESFERIQFYVNDPGEIDRIVRDVKDLPDLDPTDFIVSVDSSNVDAVMEPLTNMDRLVSILIVLVLVVGAVILCLVLSIRVKERVHESGVQLALGLSKGNIVAQYLAEILIIAAFAFSLSAFTSGFVAKTVGSQLLDYTISDRIQTPASGTPGTSFDGGIFLDSSDFAPEFEGSDPLTKIEVDVEPVMVAGMFGVGLLIICAAVMLAAAPVLRMKPREILSKMS
ncbi:MAG: ABC transporter permease [Clostridiales bacterium]|nr:ABC transporter permease [Clostridiales bacterium]